MEQSKRKCKASLAEYTKEAWHIVEPVAELEWGWCLDAICEHLEAVTFGDIKRLFITVPPGCMKSLLTGVFWPSWEWGPQGRADLRFVGTAHRVELAVRDTLKERRIIESDWYQERWPELKLTSDQNAKTKYENTAGGIRAAMPFKKMTGERGDRVLIDDPISADDANSEAELDAAKIAFTESLPTRFNNKDSAAVMIMQRLNQKDPAGLILSRELGWEHLMLPMEFEPERKCHTCIGFEDPRTEDGELLFENRFPREEVDDLKKTMGSYATAGQFQQRPAPREGGLFKRSWFNMVKAAEAGTVWARGWDLGASTDQKSPYTAGVKIGKQPSGRWIVGEVRRDQLSAGKRDAWIKSTATEDGRDCRVDLPQDPGQAGKSQALQLVAMLSGFKVSKSPESGDKITRAEPMAAQAEAGNFDMIVGKWNEPYLEEICVAPGSEFLDQLDASSRAFNCLAVPKGRAPLQGRSGSTSK